MSALFGIFNKIPADVPAPWLQQMKIASNHWLPDTCGVYLDGSIGLGCSQLWVTPESQDTVQPLSDKHSGSTLVFDGRLDNRESLRQQLQLQGAGASAASDAAIILAAYRQWGEDSARKLIGDFAFAIWDSNRKRLYLSRDPLGVRPLFVCETPEHIAFASDKHCLLALPWVATSLNDQWIADYLCITKISRTATIHAAINAFEPAHWMTCTARQTRTQRYWSLDPERELPLRSDEDYIEQFAALLEQAVACRLRSQGTVASELSGGLDSATVCSRAARLLREQGKELWAYSHVLAPELEGKVYPFTDEKPWIRELCEFADIRRHVPVYSRDRGVIAALRKNKAIHCGPSRSDLTSLGDELFEHLEAAGTRVLLSGFGGDQLVSCAANGFFEELAMDGQFATLWRELGFHHPRWMPRLSSFSAAWLRAQTPWSPRTNWRERLSRLFVNRGFAENHGYPQNWYRHSTRPTRGRVRQRQWQVISSPHVVYRVEDSALGAAAHRVEYRYPLLDIRLLEFVLALPVLQKRRQGFGRRMLRVSSEQILPAALRWRQDKSRATVPAVQHRVVRDKAALVSALEAYFPHRGGGYVDWNKLKAFGNGIDLANPQETSLKQRGFFRALMLLDYLNEPG